MCLDSPPKNNDILFFFFSFFIVVDMSVPLLMLLSRKNEFYGGIGMNNIDVPIWEKYTLTIEEAAKYFRIGESKLRKLAEENLSAGWVLMNGNRIQIKRKKFEQLIDTYEVI